MDNKFLVKAIVKKNDMGKVINIMALNGITGFYVKYCKGLDELKEGNYVKSYNILNDKREDLAIVGTVVSKKTANKIEMDLKEKLKNEEWKFLIVPVLKVKVNRV
ncbi:MJ1244 family protein [Methanocaldococcus sp.]